MRGITWSRRQVLKRYTVRRTKRGVAVEIGKIVVYFA
jgi:hypothetical protein